MHQYNKLKSDKAIVLMYMRCHS